MTRTTEIDVERLYVTAVGVKPINRDWSEGYGESWELYQAVELDDGRITDGSGEMRDEDGEWIDLADDDRTTVDERRDGPMMNYAYPLPDYSGHPAEDARSIVDLPLCIVQDHDGATFLALTGGGMDFSWEIAEAYMRLGYLPPLHFADLPGMAGKPADDDDRAVIAACKRTAEIAINWASTTLERLNRLDH